MKALALSDAIDALLVCVAHGFAPVEPLDPISLVAVANADTMGLVRLNKPDLLRAKGLLLSLDHALNYFDAESFDISAMASCTVVMNCAGKMIVEFFSTEISAIVWRVRS